MILLPPFIPDKGIKKVYHIPVIIFKHHWFSLVIDVYLTKHITFFNPLSDNKILDWSKLKQTADDILKCI